jgi:hypothetical protein
MFNVIKRATRSGVLGAGMLALLAAPTTASGAEVSVGATNGLMAEGA